MAYVLLAGAVRSYESGKDPPELDSETDEDFFIALSLDRDSAVVDVLRIGATSEETGTIVSPRRSVTTPGQFIMDSAAGISVANETSWLKDRTTFMRLPVGASSLSGVGGQKTNVTAISDLFEPLGFMKVNHAPGSVANIISISNLQERLFVHFRDQRTPHDRMDISVDAKGEEVIAVAPKDPKTKFYMLQAENCESSPTGETHVMNIYRDAYSRGWSKNSIARALKVRQLHRAFSFIGLGRLKGLVRTNRFGFDFGPKEVSLYEELHDAGDCATCPLGKTVRSDQVTADYTRATRIGEMIVADILEIKSKKLKSNKLVLVAVDDMSLYVHIKHLPKKDIASVIQAFKEICQDYKSFGWTVTAIKLDGDGAFREIAAHIAVPLGVSVIPTSPYKHAVVAERMIRTLTTLFRCTLASLPYTLSPHMFINLMEFCASSNNLVPNSHNPILSPTEQYTKRSPQYEKLLNIEYGKLVTYYNPSSQNDEMRAKVGVIIGRDVRRPGHAFIWDLIGGGVVARNDFKNLSWNQALLKAYIDAAVGSHDAVGQAMERSVYYEPSDIELGDEDVEALCEDECATAGNLHSYEGVKAAGDEGAHGSIHLNRSKEDHRKALLRLIDVANASGELLEDDADEHDGGWQSTHDEKENESRTSTENDEREADSGPITSPGVNSMESEDDEAETVGGQPCYSAEHATEPLVLRQGDHMEKQRELLFENDVEGEIKRLKKVYADEALKHAKHQNVDIMTRARARIRELKDGQAREKDRLEAIGAAVSTPSAFPVDGRVRPQPKDPPESTLKRIRGIDTANVIPSRTRSGAVLTYFGVTHFILNLSVKQAFTKLGVEDTVEALLAEMIQMSDKGVWEVKSKDQMRELYRLGRVKNILPCSVFLKEKYDADKNYLKLKARLVAHGNRQMMDDIFGAKDVDSPTVSMAVVNVLLHMAASGNWKKRVVDIAGAYLNASLKEPEYMRIPSNVVSLIETELSKRGESMESMKQTDGSVIVELKKALYGLKQAGREWYNLLASFLTDECGYVRSDIDKCLFTRTEGGTTSHLAIYVDDILIISNDGAEIERLTDLLEAKFQTVTIQEGADISFVGMEIHTDSNGDIKIRQRGYITDILKHFNVAENETAAYPCGDNIMDAPRSDETDFNPSDFKSGVMRLMYLSTRTRPDIAFVVSAMACRSETPKTSDWDKLVQVAKYLNATKDEYLVFKYGGDIKLSAFVDASFMTHRDMRGHTGYCIFADAIGSAAILFRSVKQKTVADSSTEGEVIALHELVQHLIWVISIYESMGMDIAKPIPVHNDNRSNLLLHSKDHVNFKGRSKYISRKYFSVYEHVENGTLSLVWTGTDDLVADFLTKAIQGGKFKKFKVMIGLSSEEGNIEGKCSTFNI